MNAPKTLLLVVPFLILLLLWLPAGDKKSLSDIDADAPRAVADHIARTDDTAKSMFKAEPDLVEVADPVADSSGAGLAAPELLGTQLQTSGEAELRALAIDALAEAWATWHRSVTRLTDVIGGINLSQSVLFANLLERLPPEVVAEAETIDPNEIIQRIERLNVMARALQIFEAEYSAMQQARIALEEQRKLWRHLAERHQFGLSAAQEQFGEVAAARIAAYQETENFAAATQEYKDLLALYQIDEDAINVMLDARRKALAAEQRWLELEQQITHHTIDTRAPKAIFDSARQQALEGSYDVSAKAYANATQAWLESYDKGLIVKATPAMVTVPAGSFMMGDQSGQGQRDELPVHTESLSRFAMAVTETTFAHYDAYLTAIDETPGPDDGWGRAQRPVIHLNYAQVQRFISWLSSQTGRNFALPTEAQWEYAARAGSTGPRAANLALKAHCEGCNGRGQTQTVPVGQFPPNAYGLHDMFGNVREWVADCYRSNYSESAPLQCDTRVARGGSWADLPTDLRAANRSPVKASNQSNQLGFRLVENF